MAALTRSPHTLSPRGIALVLALMFALLALHLTYAIEFMDELPEQSEDNEDSAELPATFMHSYTRDTNPRYNPKQADANFQQQWESVVPFKKVDVIKR